MDKRIFKGLLFLQKREITDYVVYSKLATRQKDEHNRTLLERIALDELRHYQFLEKITNQKVNPNRFTVMFFFFLARIFGLTFGIKLLERGEEKQQSIYHELIGKVEGIERLIADEEEHEKQLIDALNEEKLKYVSSIVLGLNDALVELTGTLAGLTLALSDARTVGLAGLITGIAASLSMASSEYLSSKEEESKSFALKSALYTGFAYILAVIFMILPYFLFTTSLISLLVTIIVVVLIIFVFNFYISVAKDYSFKKRFFEMITISLGVAALSFVIGYFAEAIISK
ncbi:MAG: rubrerythrin family protein [Bacilli bacterium]|nr:rubrerythrin family protein [Bacilli bacterium]